MKPTAAVLALLPLFAPASASAQTDEAPPAPPANSDEQPQAPLPTWEPRPVAELQVLDKNNARSADLTVPVGQSAHYGSLTITVAACMVRPPSDPPDATAYLIINDQHPGEPGFRGWMLQRSPFVSMLEHPIYDVRVLGCRAEQPSRG